MNRRLYVGNLAFAVTEPELAAVFAQEGTVVEAKVITDKETGRSRGFGFVEMATDEEADAAIRRFNDAEVSGRKLVVNIARAAEKKSNGGNGYGHQRRDRGNDRGRRDARW